MMTEEIQQGSITGFGARLKKAREAMHLSEKDAAARLHLNPNIIHILESESFSNAPPATFMRGYLKSYARLLHLSDQEVNNALETLGLSIEPTCATVSPLLTTNNLYKSDRYIHWITYLVVGVLVVMVGFWWNSHSRYSLQNTIVHNILTQQTTNTEAQSTTTNTVATAAQPSVTAAQALVPTTPPVAQQPAPAATAAPATTAQNTQTATPAAAPQVTAPTVGQNTTPPLPPHIVIPMRAPQAATAPGPASFPIATPDGLTDSKSAKLHKHDDDDDEGGVAMAVPEPGLEPN